jgi:ABC-type transport system involved in cytochrome bd biosynthesis fused ATPase/permease subunit
MEQGFDPQIKRYFVKIINSFAWGFIWILSNAMLGIYFGFAYHENKPLILNILFYLFFAASLFFLLRYFYRVWSKRDFED